MKRHISAALLILALAVVGASACSVQAYLADPHDETAIKSAVLRAIDAAVASIDLALTTFTDDELGAAVVRATRRGVRVRVILAAGQDTTLGGEYRTLTRAEIPVAIATPTGVFRYAFALIDGTLLITGSYAWSDDPASYEDAVFIRCAQGDPTLARFAAEFDRLWRRFGTAETTTSTAIPMPSQSVLIHAVDPAAECIELLNITSVPLDISGWRLSDLEGSYTFPAGTVIKPDEPYRVCIDTYNPTLDPHGLYLNDEHDEVFLITPAGKIVDERVWGNE